MPEVLLLLAAAAPAPPQLDLDKVTPGPVGFIATFAVVIAVVFLLLDFSRRVRRLKLRGEAMERAAAQAREAGRAPRADGLGRTPDTAAPPGQDPPVGRERPGGGAPPL